MVRASIPRAPAVSDMQLCWKYFRAVHLRTRYRIKTKDRDSNVTHIWFFKVYQMRQRAEWHTQQQEIEKYKKNLCKTRHPHMLTHTKAFSKTLLNWVVLFCFLKLILF